MSDLNGDQFHGMAKALQEPGGGFTHHLSSGKGVSDGWAVAHSGHETVMPASSVTPKTIRRFTARSAGTGEHVGGWHNPSDGNAYLDKSDVEPHTYHGGVTAIAKGYQHHQLAVQELGGGWNTVSMHPGESAQVRNARDSGKITPQRAAEKAKTAPGHAAEKAATATGVAALRHQRPGGEGRISNMPTKQLAQMFRDRR